MSTIVELSRIRAARDPDPAGFVVCPLCEAAAIASGRDPSGEADRWCVVTRFNSRGAFVCALVCPEHDPPFEIQVENGELFE